jgi:hypothetical protein
MGATRLIGASALPYPILRLWNKKDNKFVFKKFPYWAIFVSFFTFLGCISYFIYCQIKFGRWDLYMISSRIGWGVAHNPFDFFKPWNYIPHFFFENTEMSLDRSIGPLILSGLFFAYRKDRKWMDRIGLYFSTIAMFYLIIASKVSIDFVGVARHGYSTFILLLLAIVQLVQIPSKRRMPAKEIYLGATYSIFFVLQLYLTYRFLRGKWVE